MIVGMTQTILEATDIAKNYGKTQALKGVYLAISAGEMFGLLGPNGAGKTTLISILCGLTDATAGEVKLFGKPFTRADKEMRRLVGIGTQDLSIYPDLSARENMRFFGRLYGLGGVQLEVRIEELLASVGLAERASDRAGTFSGGMKRRLNLAVAVIHEPHLLFLDEPTTGVDPQSRNHIFEQVKSLNAAGMTVIYTSHYLEEVEALCRRIAILDGGTVKACNTLENLLALLNGTIRICVDAAPANFRELLAEIEGVLEVENATGGYELSVKTTGPALARIANLCAEKRLSLTSVTTREPSLERVFLRLTGRELRD